jgi:hypothetical protein
MQSVSEGYARNNARLAQENAELRQVIRNYEKVVAQLPDTKATLESILKAAPNGASPVT